MLRRTAQWSFAKLKNGILDLDNVPRPGRPSEVNEDRLKALLKEDKQPLNDL